MRAAFDATTRDEAFLDFAKKTGANIAPASGAAVQAMVEKLYATPAELVKLSEAIRTKGTKNR
jgi:hypothetical protein